MIGAMPAPLGAPVFNDPVIGILGGMGPAATADLLAKIAARTPVRRDQDHLRVVVWSNPKIPDRTLALQNRGPSPLPALIDGVARLQAMNVDMIAIACNTAHAFLDELQASDTTARFFNMISEAVRRTSQRYPEAERVGVLSTAGTRLAGLYAAECARLGLTAIELDDPHQARLVDTAIEGVKAARGFEQPASQIRQAVESLSDLGAEVVIAGCTEIPLVSYEASKVLPIVDATECLAEAIVDYASFDASPQPE
jgi:aspartate racemase